MASYYYLIASLPELRADGDMPLTYSEFLQCCQSNVSDSDYERLRDLTLDSSEGPLLNEWSKFYGMLKKELGYQRSMNLGKSYSSAYDKDGMIAQVVGAALASKNPLEAERMLLEYEFDNLDSLVGLHMFDDYVLFGYAIKLKLLERLSCFEQTKGKAEFNSLFEGIQQRVYSL
ncbi:MAG: DUF2764 family protein [Clostridiales bacterium]|jgi:hypothetical protein|nr:DUF2764 family protein [Clostridiales bacterium]